MGLKPQEPNDNRPVTADEVAGWFLTTKFGKPAARACLDLAKAVERTRAFFRASEADPDLVAGINGLPGVVKAARLLRAELTDLQTAKKHTTKAARLLKVRLSDLNEAAGKYAKGVEIRNLTTALDAFVKAAPGRGQGHQPSPWIGSAIKWAPMVAACLDRPGKKAPSLSSDAGPVTAVLTCALERVYGREFFADDVGRQVRLAKKARN